MATLGSDNSNGGRGGGGRGAAVADTMGKEAAAEEVEVAAVNEEKEGDATSNTA